MLLGRPASYKITSLLVLPVTFPSLTPGLLGAICCRDKLFFVPVCSYVFGYYVHWFTYMCGGSQISQYV